MLTCKLTFTHYILCFLDYFSKKSKRKIYENLGIYFFVVWFLHVLLKEWSRLSYSRLKMLSELSSWENICNTYHYIIRHWFLWWWCCCCFQTIVFGLHFLFFSFINGTGEIKGKANSYLFKGIFAVFNPIISTGTPHMWFK